MQDNIEIAVSQALVSYVEPALARLGYLYPALRWAFDAGRGQIMALGDAGEITAADLRKEVFFQLYREKVHHDTLAVRNRIYEAISP